MLERKEKEMRLWRALVPGTAVNYKHLRSSLYANTSLICPTSDVLEACFFLVATADFQGVFCEWCLLPDFRHDDGYSFAKYSQI